MLSEEEEEKVSAELRGPCVSPGGNAVTLTCWTCNKKSRVKGYDPTISADIAKAVGEAKWLVRIDFRYRRTLMFCSVGCVREATIKTGQFRMRRPRV